MTTWAEFEAAAPAIASVALRCLADRGGEVMLATVRGDGLPRIHPVNVAIVEGRLYAFVIASSPKRRDLEMDGRYAMHAHVDPAAPTEVELRGRARLVDDDAEGRLVASGWAFTVDATYAAFEFAIEAALVGARADADDWPPRYLSWSDASSAIATGRTTAGATPASA